MKRKIYCDYLRLIATFAVVVLHVSASNWYGADVHGLAWQSFNFYDSATRWSVPIFVMISGALFLGREIPIKKIYSKYILRLVIAFFTWNLFYAIMTQETSRHGIIYGLKTHKEAIVSGHYHMWFVIMIIALYMCIPFCKKIVSDTLTTKYFLILSFVFSMMIPWIVQLLKDYVVGSNEQLVKFVGIVNSKLSVMSMNMMLGYSFYFVLGYYLDKIELNKKQRIIIYILGIIGLVFTILVDLNLALKMHQPCGNYYGNFRVNVLLEVVAVYTFFKYREYKNLRLNKFVYLISQYTLGIYLIHAFFIEKYASIFKFNTLSFNAMVSVPVVSVVVFISAIIVSALLKYIPIIKKYCV